MKPWNIYNLPAVSKSLHIMQVVHNIGAELSNRDSAECSHCPSFFLVEAHLWSFDPRVFEQSAEPYQRCRWLLHISDALPIS